MIKGIPIIKIRLSHDRLIFIMGISMPGTTVFIWECYPGRHSSLRKVNTERPWRAGHPHCKCEDSCFRNLRQSDYQFRWLCGYIHRHTYTYKRDKSHSFFIGPNIDGLVKTCSDSSVLAMELLQSCTKLSIYKFDRMKNNGFLNMLYIYIYRERERDNSIDIYMYALPPKHFRCLFFHMSNSFKFPKCIYRQ